MNKMIVLTLVLCAVYSRLVGIAWGLPYPMHPDERNMATAVQGLRCEILNSKSEVPNLKDCLNPQFFAYGQVPLYTAYFLIQSSSMLFHGQWAKNISFESATIALRLISVFASLATIFVVYRLLKDFFSDFPDKNSLLLLLFLFVFSPYAIQFAHFGTTESLLMLLYMAITYFSLQIISVKKISLRIVMFIGIIAGLAIGIKISSAMFLLLPLCVIVWTLIKMHEKLYKRMIRLMIILMLLTIVSTVFILLSSPHIVLSLQEFISSMNYESGVASGAISVFYTRQFLFSIPMVYQLTKVFPVSLGYGIYVLFGLGFFLLPIKDSRINMLRIALLLYIIPGSLLFVKWTRFVAPVLPIACIVGALVLAKIIQLAPDHMKRIVTICLVIICAIPGIAYLSIYQHNDVRFQASEWIYKNISSTAHVFSEAGNVINIPIPGPPYKKEVVNPDVLNFDFYSVDSSKELQDTLVAAMKQSEYIFVPSRRIVGSVTCHLNESRIGYDNDRCEQLKHLYPVTNEYYDKLGDASAAGLGFALCKTFTSYPKIELFGKTMLEFPDEQYDETWSVFDHPVIRIYKRI